MSNENDIRTLPLIPVRNTVIFPYLLMPVTAGRTISINAAQAAALREEKDVFIVAQRDTAVETPTQQDLYTVGTIGVIRKMARPKQDSINLVIQGVERATLIKVEQTDPYYTARVADLPMPEEKNTEIDALRLAVVDLALKTFQLAQPEGLIDFNQVFANAGDPIELVYILGSILNLPQEREQQLLEAPNRIEALRMIHADLSHQIQVLELRNKIAKQAQTEMTKEQREYLLKQQMRAIQQELKEENPEETEAKLLEEQIEQADLPEEAKKEARREIAKLKKLPSMAPEYHVIRGYLELVAELPWHKQTEDTIEISHAREVLDQDHYDLKEVKERILEHLGVLKLNPAAKSPILCFVGAPGVGKTSLGQSIARAIGRKFERLSLGGMHDEAELRGHRRTYIGAMPGGVITALRRAAVNNPVLMLDEVDKLGRDFRGDPAAALLEILDPEQNRKFRDNYLDLPFDLSKIFFITTANVLDTIPRPLLDRMEILHLAGYSEDEKVQIATRYLIPRQLKEAGLSAEQLPFAPEVLRVMISRYTREAGVRQLERTIGRLARKTALLLAEGKKDLPAVTPENIADFLGPERFFQEQARVDIPPGVATGLAWTEAGGDVLYVEATILPDGNSLILTGQLGDVMQESARTAHSYVWSSADRLHINRDQFHKSGVHIHVPAGATPKDGPSAGVTIATALASLYLGIPVDHLTAMTGEITLTGLVLPVGGIKEKVLAAHRAKLKRVILPKENRKDLREIPAEVQSQLEFIFAETIEDVFQAAIPRLANRAQAAELQPAGV